MPMSYAPQPQPAPAARSSTGCLLVLGLLVIAGGAISATMLVAGRVQTPEEQRAAHAAAVAQRAAADVAAAAAAREQVAFAALDDEGHLRAAAAALGVRGSGVAGGQDALRHLDAIPAASPLRRQAARLRHELEARILEAENQARVRNASLVFDALIRQRRRVESVQAEPYNHTAALSTLRVVWVSCDFVTLNDLVRAGDLWSKGFRRVICERPYTHRTYTLDGP